MMAVMADTSEKELSKSQPAFKDEEFSGRGDVAGHFPESEGLKILQTSYDVTWTVYIALAVSREERIDVPAAPKEKTKTTSTDSSAVWSKAGNKAQSCYHIEYKLLPGDTETTRLDLLVFGPVAKMCRDAGVKILKVHHGAERSWIGWTDSFSVRTNRDTVISLLRHEINLKIWNSRDKLSGFARCERLRPLRLSLEQTENTTAQPDVPTDSTWAPRVSTGFQKPQRRTCDVEDILKNDGASVQINPICFLAGETSLSERFPVRSCGVYELLCNISLDRPLLSADLKRDLNPLVITIASATSLPSSPTPLHVLQEKCGPVYCQYQIQDSGIHRTKLHHHDANVYFRDVNVLLTGLMSPEELRDFLARQPLQIEVHDRDRKLEETSSTSMSGMVPQDFPLENKAKIFHSYGVASLNLSEMLLGRKSASVDLPIKCGPRPLKAKRPKSARKSQVLALDDVEPMPQGHYYEANSQLKVRVDIACPLNTKKDGRGYYDGQFGRIVFLFGVNNVSARTKLTSEILRTNGAAFHLRSEDAPSHHGGLMKTQRDERTDLDFVTGFHVVDTTSHIFVLEGLKHKAVRRLWEAVPMKRSGSEEEQVIVLYNSALAFFKRIYDSLDASLTPIRLRESLQSIMKQPLVYVRGRVAWPCFQALSRLSQLCKARHLRDAADHDLFPSADMIVSMREECGSSVALWEQKARANTETDLPVRTKRHAASLDAHNTEYTRWKHDGQRMAACRLRDFIQENIQKVHAQSERSQKPKVVALKVERTETAPAHNYSIQTFNSYEETKELLQREMANVPGRRFTYSQQFLGATLEPGNKIPQNDVRASSSSSSSWVTNYSGDRFGANPRRPDEARIEELRKPWRENVLHANTLKPPLSRDTWVWTLRGEDFQLRGKPPPFFGSPPPHLTGESLEGGGRLKEPQLRTDTGRGK